LNQRNRLLARLGRNDQLRLSQHFDEIRALEQRIAALPPPTSATCRLLPNPGPDPAIGSNSSNEYLRNRVFLDLIHMAFVCDMTRSVSHMITTPQCHMDIRSCHPVLANVTADQHELGHSGILPQAPAGTAFVDLKPGFQRNFYGGSYAMSLVHTWHIEHFCYLVNKLKNTAEGAGNVLDNSALLMMFEGGHGLVDNAGTDKKPIGSHSTLNMAMLIAGRAGGLRPGKHIAKPDMHPAKVTISAMAAVGGPQSLGQISGTVPELFA
jgi:hypothetical protein